MPTLLLASLSPMPAFAAETLQAPPIPRPAQMSESEAALHKTTEALNQDPNSLDLRLERARMATWNGDYGIAEQDYQILRGQDPGNDAYLLSLAQVQSWGGKLDEPARNFSDYLTRNPQDAEAILGYAYVQSWRGNYAHALELMETYRDEGGDIKQYDQARARFLARSARTRSAVELADQTLEEQPDNFHALFSKTVAYKEGQRVEKSLSSFEKLQECCADEPVMKDLERFVKTPARHAIEGGMVVGADSDEIFSGEVYTKGQYRAESGVYLTAGAGRGVMRAETGSGLDAVDGTSEVTDTIGWGGIKVEAADGLWLEGAVGAHDTSKSDVTPYAKLGAQWRPIDEATIYATVDHDFHRVSPRALSRDITRVKGNVRAVVQPTQRITVDSYGEYADYSDGNSHWTVSAAPRHNVLRTEDINLDVGVSGRWTSFDDKPGNGYYSPSFYHQYLVTSFAYFKLSDDDGISLIVAPGVHSDETIKGLQFSGSVATEATFGLYRDWMLKLRGGFIHNIGVNGNAYRRGEVGASVTKRF